MNAGSPTPAPASPELPSPGRPSALGVLIGAMALVVVPLIVLSQFAAHLRIDVVDDQMFGYYGWRILHGATVYLDVWDNKPPGIYWINALGFLLGGGEHYGGVIALCVLALCAAHACFFCICSSLYFRDAAAVATIIASFYLTHAYYQTGANRTETFLVAFELAAALIYIRAHARDRWFKWLVVGALCGCAALCKQVGLAAWGAMGLHTIFLMFTRDLSVAAGVRRGVLLVAGLALTLTAASAYLASQGALAEAWFATVTFNRAYFAVGHSKFFDIYVNYMLLSQEVLAVLLLPILMAIAALLHAFLWWVRPRLTPPEIEAPLRSIRPTCPHAMVFFLIWFAIAAYGAAVSPHRFRHYVIPIVPPLLLMAGQLVNVLQAEMGLLRRLQQRAWVAAAFVAMGYFSLGAGQRQLETVSKIYIARIEQREPAVWEEIGNEVAALTRPGDRIQCWDYLPGVYLQARRLNACRFTTTEKIGQVGAQADFIKRELYDTLMRSPPELIAMSANTYDMIHGLSGYPESSDPIKPWMDAHYTLAADNPRFNIYLFLRNDRTVHERATTLTAP
ncbi:MAG: ArnT family glycosyltransferase [Phycisphaerae bacterium]